MIPRFIKKTDAFYLIALITVLVAGWILRAQVTVVHDLIPGVNGAYYLIQARAILHTGALGIPDFPLLFYLQAGLGALFSLFTPMNRAIFIAVRLTDTIIPVLIAVPVFLFVRAFYGAGKQRYTTIIGALSVGLIAVGNRGLLHMAGDFQKNAAALPLFLTFAFFLYLSLRNHRRRDIIVTLIFFCLTCLTHIGVAALALLFTGFVVMTDIISNKNYRQALVIVSVLTASLSLSLGLVFLFDPERVVKLLAASFNPGKLFEGSLVSTWAEIGFRIPPLDIDGIVLGNVTGIIGLATAVLYRKRMDHPTSNVLYAASLTALVFASPLIGRDLAQRLSLMAFVPGLIPLAFIVSRQRWLAIFSLVTAVVLFVTTVLGLTGNFQQTITPAAYAELQSFKKALPGGNTMVIARHGLEWWAAWTMDTKVANKPEAVLNTWDTYDAVFFLEEINPDAFTGGDFQHRHAGPPAGLPFMHRPRRRNAPTPPPFPGFMGGQGFRGPGENFFDPDNLIPIQEGAFFRLSRIMKKPDRTLPDAF